MTESTKSTQITSEPTLSTGYFSKSFYYPALKKCRVTVPADIPRIQHLVTKEVTDVFRDEPLNEFMEISMISLIRDNYESDPALVACFDVRPQISSLSHSSWKHFVHAKFGLTNMTDENTWFITLILLDPRYLKSENFEPVLNGLFLRNPKKENFAVYLPPGAKPRYLYPILKKYFKRYYPKGSRSPGSPKLYICSRERSFPRCKLRRAMAADNDNLVQMLDQQSPLLRKIYGDYFIANIVQNQTVPRFVLVVEQNNVVLGMFCINGSSLQSSLNGLVGNELQSLAYLEDTMDNRLGSIEWHSNAFVIELVAFADGVDEYVAYELLAGAFELFPHREYCIIGMPSYQRAYKFLRLFTKLSPFKNYQLNQEIYVQQRNLCLSSFSVRRFTIEDYNAVYYFLEELEILNDFLLEAEQSCGLCQASNGIHSFVLLAEDQIVGVCLIEELREDDIRQFILSFDFDELNDTKSFVSNKVHGLIKQVIVLPAFVPRWDIMIQQMSKATEIDAFYYKIENASQQNLCSILSMMRPLRPRKKTKYGIDQFLKRGVEYPVFSLAEPDPFALYFTNKRLTVNQKKHINLKIVVVGGGRTAWSFLETLIFDKLSANTWLTNLTLINPNGSCDFYATNYYDTDLFPYHGSHSKNYMAQLHLPTWVNVISGVVTSIDRTTQHVILNQNRFVSYDVLYLFYGLQFYPPEKLLHHHESPPSNLVQINRKQDLDFFLIRCQTTLRTESSTFKNRSLIDKKAFKNDFYAAENCIIYGVNAHSLSLLQICLDNGYDGQKFTVVSNSQDDFYSYDIFIQNFLKSQFDEGKIEFICKYELASWTTDTMNSIKSVTFKSQTTGELLELKCAMLLYFGIKTVDQRTIESLNKSGLVFDGRLVIDLNGQTNDSHIFAAGPFTRFKRIYLADEYRHENYNSAEIGSNLGHQLMLNLKNKNNSLDFSEEEKFRSIKMLKQPLVDYFKLPGNYNYLYIRPPGKFDGSYEFKNGLNLVTTYHDTSAQNLRYFKIHLNERNIIDVVVCMCKEKICVDNYTRLYGQQESLFNSLLHRFNCRKIDDFFEYFQEPWVYAIYHDRFYFLQEENQNLIAAHMAECKRSGLKNELSNEVVEQIEKNTARFLEKYADELPMYAKLKNLG